MRENYNIKILLAFLISIVVIIFIVLFGYNKLFENYYNNFQNFISSVKNDINIKREKRQRVEKLGDLYGFWKDDSFGFENRYEALIDFESITIYKYQNNIPNLYWIGTFFVANDENNSEIKNIKNEIISYNYKSITDFVSRDTKVSLSDTKNIIVRFDEIEKDFVIEFVSQYDDKYENVILKHYDLYNDRIRSIKYPNEKNRIEYYDDRTNNELMIGEYRITYPAYFNHMEEESRPSKIINSILPSDFEPSNDLYENNFLIYSPEDTNSYAELFVGEYKNIEIDDREMFSFVALDCDESLSPPENKLLSYKFTEDKNTYIMTSVISNKYITGADKKISYGIEIKTDLYDKKTKTLITIGIAYTNDDKSKYNYLEDYKLIIKNLKKQ